MTPEGGIHTTPAAPALNLQFVTIPAGSFYMGSCRTGTPCPSNAGTAWQNPSFSQSNDQPVVNINYLDAQAFIAWLNSQEGDCLPTEAEWEYAARAGATSRYSWGNSFAQANTYAWHGGNAGGRTHTVGSKQPNPWGLYDMHGNVWEWVQDWYDTDYYSNNPTDNP